MDPGSILLKIAAVLFLVGINAYFVAAEFSLVAVRRARRVDPLVLGLFVIIKGSAMPVATFQDKLIGSGARVASYRGAETPASFGDTAAEFRALLTGAGVFDMSWQAKLKISGKDRTRWANGMVSNNIRDLAPRRRWRISTSALYRRHRKPPC